MTYTIIMIVSVIIVLGIAAAFGLAVNAGYKYKHTVDPLPEDSKKDKAASESEKQTKS